MQDLMEHIRNERKRLREVRETLSHTLASARQHDDALVEFYVAIADYIEAAMDRLDTQDVRMGDMLRARVSNADAEAQNALQELDDRLAGNTAHLNRFLQARECLKTKGTEAIEKFESAARAYTDYITSNMGHHGGSTDLARHYFSEEDWIYMANVKDEDIEREQVLFNTVFTCTPDGFDVRASA